MTGNEMRPMRKISLLLLLLCVCAFSHCGYRKPAPVPFSGGIDRGGREAGDASRLDVSLEEMINRYRETKGLPPIPHSAALRRVAEAHARDLADRHPEEGCGGNLHSWSNRGNWKGGCYDPDDSGTWPVMWLKPREIAGDDRYGYEIVCKGAPTPALSLDCWRASRPHHNVILNRGTWRQAWNGMGAAMYGGYAVAWFER